MHKELRKPAFCVATIAAVASALAVMLSSRDAHALGPIDLEAAAKVGVGTNPGSGTINPLGFGIGGRAGVTFLGIYGGLNFVDYLGGTDNTNDSTQGLSEHALMYGLELGYQLKLAILTIRPQVGFGNLSFTTSQDSSVVQPQGGATAPTGSESHFYLEPGVVALLSFGYIIAGLDANALIITGVDDGSGSSKVETAFTLHGQVGVRF